MPRLAPRPSPVGLVVAALPFALLLAVSIAALLRTPEPASTRPLVADPMQRSLDAAGELRLRHAIEAHRFLEGRLPASLAELPPSATAPAPLAAGAPRPYYFDSKGGRYVLLPPAD